MTSSVVPTHTRNQPQNRNRSRHNKDPCFDRNRIPEPSNDNCRERTSYGFPGANFWNRNWSRPSFQQTTPSETLKRHSCRDTQHEGLIKSLACRIQTLRLQPKRIENLSGRENARQVGSIEILAEELRSTQRGMQFNSVPTLLARSVAQGERASSFQKKLLKASSPPLMFCHMATGQTHLN